FITPQDGSGDIFVHTTGLKNQVREGDEVTYEVERTPKGLNAINVRLS
ncbi:cold-shock protein, partial [Sphingobacterium spiritivorum]